MPIADDEDIARARQAADVAKSIQKNKTSKPTEKEKAAATAATVAAGGKSTDPKNRLPGETASEANARITAGYKELLAKPVLSEDAINAGAKVRFVRVGEGGQGEYTVVTPVNYKGPSIITTKWTEGIIPSTGKYTSGTTLGVQSTGTGTYTKVGGANPIVGTSTVGVGVSTTGTLTNDLWTESDKILRTATSFDDAIAKAVLLAKTLPDNIFGNRYDESTGKLLPASMAQKVETILAQMGTTAKTRQSTTLEGSVQRQLADRLTNNPGLMAAVAKGLSNDPSSWMYKPGQTFTRGDMTYWVIDPTKTNLSKEELDKIRATNEGRVNIVNPITGNVMEFDPNDGRIFGLGAGPTSTTRFNGDLISEGYNTPGKSWVTNPDGTITYLDGPNAGKTVANPNVGTANMPYYGGGSFTDMPYNGENFGTQNMGYGQDLTNSNLYNANQYAALQERKSAYNLLYNEFNKYGLGSLVEGIKGLIQENVSPSEFAIRLQDTEAYKKRFAANQDRIKQGLRALTPAEYIGLEDQYQNIMRNYGLPASYWSKDSMGTQAGFNKFIANDVSAAELEDRIATAQKRVINADVNVKDALRSFYPDITDADILAYTLDPTNALENIKRKVTAAEIGGAALGQGLGTTRASAEDLAKYGITKAQAQQGYGAIAEFLPTATKLGDIYSQQGLGAYDQATAEKEVFGTAGAADAARKRKKLSQLEQAAFSGQAGTAQGALARDRAGSI